MSRLRIGLIALVLLFIAAVIALKGQVSRNCLATEHGISICAMSDMARVTRSGEIRLEHTAFAIADHGLSLNAARNDVIAFQLLIKRTQAEAPDKIAISLSDLNAVSPDQNKPSSVLLAQANSQLFQAHYHWVEHGGYEWGPTSEVLPWPDFYPDALIPKTMQCGDQKQTLFDQFTVPKKTGENQSIWVDWYIPRDQIAGEYRGNINLSVADQSLEIPLTITVYDVTLPDETTIDAVGEIYDPYKLEGIKTDLTDPEWQKMAHCYQQLAHQHRMIFIERLHVNNEDEKKWRGYREYADPILNGSLFSAENGYIGPGAGTPVTMWRTPWAQAYNARVEKPLAEARVEKYQQLAKKWQQEVDKNQWSKTEYFAYVFDEVDGATDEDELGDVPADYIEMVHTQMQRVQQAIDAGAGKRSIDLIWTSHTDPSTWAGIEKEDLAGITRLWSPSANSANVDYLQQRKELGETIWYYHAGHPSIGIHAVNAPGVEMRTWGLINARYGFDGHLMWAINLSDETEPYSYPSYKRDDDRFGNGTLVYPGYKLDTIGLKPVPGPIPSMRLKAWRQGLQDAELVNLLRTKDQNSFVNAKLKALIPNALSEGKKQASWSNDMNDGWDFRNELLRQLSKSDQE